MKIKVSAIDLSKTYGEKGYELMYSFDRLAREDRLTGIILTREEGEDVGTYKIKVSQKEDQIQIMILLLKMEHIQLIHYRLIKEQLY